MKDSKTSKEALSRTAEMKSGGSGKRVDLPTTKQDFESPMFDEYLMEEICERENLRMALKRVIANKGSPGVDGMTVDEISGYLVTNWIWIKDYLLKGDYKPQLVKRVEIPKPGTTERRKLGIPCVLDRLIQQATLQVLQNKWDPCFSDFSFGFRPGRSCHQAISVAQSYIRDGCSILVDIDLAQFFDRVCHDRLMSRLARSIPDKRVLTLIRRYLQAGIMDSGLVTVPTEGAPQGGPLSPFISNVVLHELDKELESRSLKFVRYADDCNIYVKSQRAGERVMASISGFIENKLKLKVNVKKSAVGRPQDRKFLGFSFTGGKLPNRRKIAPQSLIRFKAKVRSLTRRKHSMSLKARVKSLSTYLRGWKGYYGFCETQRSLMDLDSWIRRRLRCIQWKQWKTYKRRKAELIKLGVRYDLAQTTAWSSKGPWNLSHTPGVRMALSNKYFDSLGLVRLGKR